METGDIVFESATNIMVQSSEDLFADPSQDDMGSGSAPETSPETRIEFMLEAEEYYSDLVESTNHKKEEKTRLEKPNTSPKTSTSFRPETKKFVVVKNKSMHRPVKT